MWLLWGTIWSAYQLHFIVLPWCIIQWAIIEIRWLWQMVIYNTGTSFRGVNFTLTICLWNTYAAIAFNNFFLTERQNCSEASTGIRPPLMLRNLLNVTPEDSVQQKVQMYSISQEICTRFCCALLCCGYAIVHNEFTWSIYPYSSGLLCWHWGNR